jgi:hypothetical protein
VVWSRRVSQKATATKMNKFKIIFFLSVLSPQKLVKQQSFPYTSRFGIDGKNRPVLCFLENERGRILRANSISIECGYWQRGSLFTARHLSETHSFDSRLPLESSKVRKIYIISYFHHSTLDTPRDRAVIVSDFRFCHHHHHHCLPGV